MMTIAAERDIRVLHVDDEPGFAEMAGEFLARHSESISVETATRVSEGLERLNRDEFDCIVSDHDMPGKNGIEFLTEVRERDPEVPFILFTGKGSEEIASEAISAGVTDYLQKGGGADQYAVLANRIVNSAEAYRAERSLERRKVLDEAIASFSRDALNGVQVEKLIDEAVGIVSDLLDCDYAAVLELSDDESVLNFVAGDGWETTWSESAVDAESNRSPGGFALSHLESVVSESYAEDARFEIPSILAEHDVTSGVITPIGSEDDPWGVLEIHSRSDTQHSEDDVRFIQNMANILGTAIERHSSEEQLRESESRFREITELSPDTIFRLDTDGSFQYVSPAIESLLDYTPDEILGTGFEQHVASVSHEEALRSFSTVVSGEVVRKLDITLRDAEGEPVEIEVSANPVEDDGEVMLVQGFARDVTERKQRERELEQVTDLLDRTERIADVGGWEIDTDTQDVYWTENLFEILGVEYEEEPDLETALDLYHDEDRPVIAGAVEDALQTGEPFDVEVRLCRPDGELRWVHVQGIPSTVDGEVVTLRGAFQDVTDRRNRERVLRDMYEIISDRDRSFEEQVGAMLELGRTELGTEYGTLSEIRGSEYLFEVVAGGDGSITPGEVVPVSASNCEIAASTEQTLVLGDIEQDAPEYTDRAGYVEMGIACYLGAPVYVDEDVYGTFCFYDTEPRADQFTDWEVTLVDLMSRWVSSELERREAVEHLRGQNERLDQFTSIVSHDLRNQLSVVNGSIELALETGDLDHLSRGRSAVDRMDTLIEDLLTLARQGATVTELSATNLAVVVEDSWRIVDSGTATLISNVNGSITADESRLKQLFENLLRNAVEHGNKDIVITIGHLDTGFFIEDNGPGIPPEDRELIFDAGYSTSDDGTGFGLSIVENIVESHGWDIRLTESAAGGARFEVTGLESLAG